jgi:pimeloyl-ACP methyl ester carboxylesterase
MTFQVVSTDFISRGTRCAGWLYQPEGSDRPPVLIMAHGFAAESSFGLPAFAERFTEAGIAVFVFDYRNFGLSDGEPRNLVNPFRHVQDWHAAIARVRSLPHVDGGRLALWGSSFSGGHVMVVAAKDPGIAAIVSQVPFVDVWATVGEFGPGKIAKSFALGFRDLLRIATFRGAYNIPVVADPDGFAVMNTPDAKPGYLALVPEDSAWKNRCPARILLTVQFYRPIKSAPKVKCPALIIAAEKDSIIPLKAVEKTAALMENATLVRMPLGHFEIYVGEPFEEVVKVETDFLKEHLLGGQKAAGG